MSKTQIAPTDSNEPSGNDAYTIGNTTNDNSIKRSLNTAGNGSWNAPNTTIASNSQGTSTNSITAQLDSSRETSPIRSSFPTKITPLTISAAPAPPAPPPLLPPAPLASPSPSRSTFDRPSKNSRKTISPVRSSPNSKDTNNTNAIPSTAHIARQIPELHHANSEPVIPKANFPLPQKVDIISSETRESQRPAKLRSAPPLTNNRQVATVRKAEQQLPIINIQKSSPSPTRSPITNSHSGNDTSTTLASKPSVRALSAALETVDESSPPETTLMAVSSKDNDAQDTQQPVNTESNGMSKVMHPKSRASNESGSDSGGPKGETQMRSTSVALTPSLRPSTTVPTKPYSTIAGRGKSSLGEGSARHMTVETETVSSIPQVAVSGTGGAGINGSLRAKPSSETIRPKKEKKKIPRKAPSVASGMGEHNLSSDIRLRLHHHHEPSRSVSGGSLRLLSLDDLSISLKDGEDGSSNQSRKSSLSPLRVTNPRKSVSCIKLTKNPLLASSKADIFEAKIASAVDEANSSDSEETFVYESNPPEPQQHRRYHSRTPSGASMASQLDHRGNHHPGHSVATKKSMKFANNYANASESGINNDDGRSTVRSNVGGTNRTANHHHGRWRSNGGNGHSSIFDESIFPAVKNKFGANNSRHSSRPSSPRLNKAMIGKRNSPISSTYDIDDGAGADDERTPLMANSLRSARSGRNRRPYTSSSRQLEHQADGDDNSLMSRFSGCLLLVMVIMLVVGGGFGFTYATTQPLIDVRVLGLKNVLVSQQELMLDMEVMARNPNVVVVTVDSMNVEVFARSKHAEDWDWFKLPGVRRDKRTLALADSPDDEPPADDDPDETQTLKLGQILEFDSPLTFEGSPFSYSHTKATGGVRLANPGNTTEAGGEDGMDKWAKVLKYEFDLRIKGILEYQLPLSQKVRKASVDFTTRVKPSKDRGPDDGTSKKRLAADMTM